MGKFWWSMECRRVISNGLGMLVIGCRNDGFELLILMVRSIGERVWSDVVIL